MAIETTLIKGGRVVDPSSSCDELKDVLIEGERIKAVDAPGSFDSQTVSNTVDASGMMVTPGLVDIHVHLREPGFEWKETIESGARAAVAGGFTTVCCMPNTNPVNDHGQITEFMLEKAEEAGYANVLPIGAITMNIEGKSLAPMIELRDAGCVAFSDDGHPVWDSGVMRKALEYSLMLDTVLTCHEEDTRLSDGFSMNESAQSVRMGLKGMPEAAENVMIARDIELARLTGGRVHFCHVSNARGAELIRRAKEDGIPVTAETMPHYLTLTEATIGEFDAMAKVSMPLRKEEDVAALQQALADGVIDCIASDHAPHEIDSKLVEFDRASFGLIGLQTTLPLTMRLVREEKLTMLRAIQALTTDASRCLNLTAATLTAGSIADIAVIDTERRYSFDKACNESKSFNTPFLGHEMQGMAIKTFVSGQEVYSYAEKEKGL